MPDRQPLQRMHVRAQARQASAFRGRICRHKRRSVQQAFVSQVPLLFSFATHSTYTCGRPQPVGSWTQGAPSHMLAGGTRLMEILAFDEALVAILITLFDQHNRDSIFDRILPSARAANQEIVLK